ncbi:hypothetical protein C8J56DRAFT_1044705 [Mycena floridula]|nr:hypothetical protein C8J56DRAFT_1044705 [Mycena floridula]
MAASQKHRCLAQSTNNPIQSDKDRHDQRLVHASCILRPLPPRALQKTFHNGCSDTPNPVSLTSLTIQGTARTEYSNGADSPDKDFPDLIDAPVDE